MSQAKTWVGGEGMSVPDRGNRRCKIPGGRQQSTEGRSGRGGGQEMTSEAGLIKDLSINLLN